MGNITMLPFCPPCMSINETDLDNKITELYKSCSKPFLTGPLIRSRNHREYNLLKSIIRRATIHQLKKREPQILITCALKVLLKYTPTPIHLEPHLTARNREHRRRIAITYLDRLLIIFKDRHDEIVKIVVKFLETEHLWIARRYSSAASGRLLIVGFSGAKLCHVLCDCLDRVSDPSEGKLLVRVIYELLNTYYWPDEPKTTVFLERLLGLYRDTLRENTETGVLRGSLELCVRHIARNVPSNQLVVIVRHMVNWATGPDVIGDHIIASYGSALEYVAAAHQGSSFNKCFGNDLLPLLMDMIASADQFVSLLGNRVLQYLIDRGNNRALFSVPKIFFEDAKVNLTIGSGRKDDSDFLKLHRELIHHSLIKSFINHAHAKLNLETTYCTVCLLTIEVPCGFTAAAISCLVMGLQDNVRRHADTIGKEASYHIHAVIISVLSLICWVHKARHFHTYVHGIVMERAQWAPHLNPPIRTTYKYAVHHVLWDKPELFLDDWEVRYGLWKRFRLEGIDTPRHSQIALKNMIQK